MKVTSDYLTPEQLQIAEKIVEERTPGPVKPKTSRSLFDVSSRTELNEFNRLLYSTPHFEALDRYLETKNPEDLAEARKHF